MSAPSNDGWWLTPPPANDGSAVWSDERYSSSIEPGGLAEATTGSFSFAGAGDFGYPSSWTNPVAPSVGSFFGRPEFSGPASYDNYGGYARPANASYAATYPYYANYPGAVGPQGGPQSLPPYWPRPEADQPTDGLAIAALICGLLGISVIAIGLALGALSRIGRTGRRGRGLAVAGLILGVIGLLASILLVVLVNNGDRATATRDSSGAIAAKGTLRATDLRTGDCAELPATLGTLTKVTVMPCAQPHNAQVYTSLVSTDSRYPGTTQIEQEGLDSCQNSLANFLGVQTTQLHVVALVPNSTTWGTGDRSITCLAVDRQADITGDIREHI